VFDIPDIDRFTASWLWLDTGFNDLWCRVRVTLEEQAQTEERNVHFKFVAEQMVGVPVIASSSGENTA
jgi:hypothetical protein